MPFGFVHRGVRFAQQLIAVDVPVAQDHAGADRSADPGVPCGHHGIGHRGLHPRDQGLGVLPVGDSVDQDDELVPA